LPSVAVTLAGAVSRRDTQISGLTIEFTVALTYITANLATIEPPDAVQTTLSQSNVVVPPEWAHTSPVRACQPVV
jgi:hypothetical protein